MRGGCRPLTRPASLLRFILLLLFLLPGFSLQAEEPSYLSSLLSAAQQTELWKDPYWHTLLHYKESLFGLRSQVDDPRFFLAPSGKSDPRAELEATLQSFFSVEEDETQHPVCRFIARYHWLVEKLKIDPSRLPVPECGRFADIMDQVKPASVTLIFPAAHINSPASMFGHTFLTVDTASKSRLLAYAINYSAVTRETFGPVFAIKGLFGFYQGYFSILPYYAKLQEYSDINNRDIWEYPLNLSGDEIKRLLLHTYEMDKIYSDYYFFDENCSYDLLFLLDAARPSIGLTDQFSSWVIPIDTIRKVKENGLITGAIYRPSRATKIKYLASLLPRSNGRIALALARGEREPDRLLAEEIDPEKKILISDLASEYLQYQHAKKKVDTEEFQERFWKILRVRSSLGGPDEDYRIPPPDRPDVGHLSNRLRLGSGVREGSFFTEVAFRPAYHDLLDNERGYVEGAQIIFTDAALRFYPSDRKLLLHKLDIIDITSLSPRDAFFKPFSWKIKTGFIRRTGTDGDDHLFYQLNPGGGFSYTLNKKDLLYFLGETDFSLGGGLEGNYALGIGASGGFFTNLTRAWKIHLFGRGMHYALGDKHNAWEAGLHQNFTLGTNTALRFELGFSRINGHEATEAGLFCNIFL
jgi:hypothetical protein